jgi:3-methyladenine DNA glycosylase AlkD
MTSGRPDHELVVLVRASLAAARDPERAAGQQRYMRSAMPFHGVTSPQLRELLVPLLREHPPRGRDTWEATVRELWDGATHREERYAALTLAEHRAARGWQDPAVLDLYRHLVVTGAWWDTVDRIAGRLVGGVLRGHRVEVTPVLDDWAVAEDLWLRRTAILSQLSHREATDTALLERCVRANLEGSRFGSDFFVRKAVGWALRQHARTDPAWVLALVEELGDRLSGLSRREALKHLGG